MTDTDKNLDRALTLAAEFARLCRDGRLAEAYQASNTIDDLVGYLDEERVFRVPPAVFRVMYGRDPDETGCPTCLGVGRVAWNPCPTCQTTGVVRVSHQTTTTPADGVSHDD